MDKTTGDMKSTFQIFSDLKDDWNNMTNAEKQNLAITYAGKNQFEVFAAVMDNFQTALDATATAYDSAGSAAGENAAAMESLQKKIDNLKGVFEDFANRVITSEFLGSLIDAGTKLLEFANTDIGAATTQAVLFGGAITGVVGIIGTFISAIAETITALSGLKKGKDIVGTLANAKWTVIAIAAGLVAAAIIGIVEAIKKWKETHTPEFKVEQFKESKEEAKEYGDKLTEAKARLDELNNTPLRDRSDAWYAEKQEIEALIAEYERLKQAAEEAAQAQAGDILGDIDIKKPVGAMGGASGIWAQYIAGMIGDVTQYSEETQGVFKLLDSLGGQAYLSTADAVQAYYNALKDVLGLDPATTFEDQKRALEDVGITFGEVSVSISEGTLALRNLTQQLNDADVPSEKLLSTMEQFLESNKQNYDSLKALQEQGVQLELSELSFIAAYEYAIQTYERGRAAADRYKDAVSEIDKVLGSMDKGTQNLNSSLSLAADALAKAGYSADEARAYLKQFAEDNGLQWTQEQIDAVVNKLVELGAIKLEDKELNVEADVTDVEDKAAEVAELMGELEGQGFEVSSPEELETLKSALEEVQDLIKGISDKSIKIQLNTDDASQKITDLVAEIVAIGDNEVQLGLNADQISQAQSLVSTIQSMPQVRNIQVNVVGDGALESVTAIQTAIDGIAQGEIPTISVADEASGVLTAIQGLIAGIHSKTVIITTIHRTINLGGGGGGHRATGTNYHGGGQTLINDGAPVNGSRAELVVSDGVGRIYDDGETTIQDIPRGAKIYTAAQTQKILKGRGLTVEDVADNPIPAMANGNVSSIRDKYTDYRNNPAYSGVTRLSGSGETLEKNFKAWLDEKKHWLELDLITEAQYYRDLEIMNERYLKNLADAKDDYWKHEEEIYKFQNEALENQLELEEKLSDLAKAKEQRVLVYADGRFQYMQNLEAIAAAQREVDELQGKYASGTTNARGGLSLVGEQGAELRVLNQGDGIIPADATKNLMSLSKFNAKDLISGIGKAIVNNYSFDISRLELPNVANAGDFLDGLKNLAYQYSYARA